MSAPDTSVITVYEPGDDFILTVTRQTPRALFWIPVSRNRPAIVGAVVIGVMVFMALFAPLIAPYSPYDPDLNHVVQPPGSGHIMGTDDLGRDVLSRIIFGARISVAASIVPVLIALGIGVPLGLLAGYFRGFCVEWTILCVVDSVPV